MFEPEENEEESLGRAIRKFVCSCFCEFYLPDGIEPSFCPHCGGSIGTVKILPSDEDLGYYREP